MRKKISKKQIGAVGMAAMMAVQTPAMAVETTKETPAQETTQETSVETSTEGVEVEETEASTEGIQTVEVSTEEMQAAEEVVTEAAEELQETTEETQETMLSTEPVEIENVSEPAEVETEADIVALAAEEDGWHENSDGSRYYVKNGETLKDCVEKIGNSYYGFDGNGSLYSEGEFDIWNSETAKYDYYRAKADGSLYVNEWYEWHPSEPGPAKDSKYYYGEGGIRYTGLHTIEGKQYYFSEWGWLYTDETVTAENGKNYYCDVDGVATELPENGWVEISGERFYVKDGAIVKYNIIEIDGAYYGFDWNGKMYFNTSFAIGGPGNADYYRAKVDGSLYANEWYIYDEANKSYYGADAKQYSGLHIIEEKQYYFSESG